MSPVVIVAHGCTPAGYWCCVRVDGWYFDAAGHATPEGAYLAAERGARARADAST